MRIKLNDIVYCLGDGDEFFRVTDIRADKTGAWLDDVTGGCNGWEETGKLKIVPRKDIVARIKKLKRILANLESL